MKTNFKRILTLSMVLTLILNVVFSTNIFASQIEFTPYNSGWLQGVNLTSYDLRDKADILPTLSFNSVTKWPSADKLPANFNPQKILEYGKQPTLGLDNLHLQGYTGKGVNIAYIDQPNQSDHPEFINANIKYFNTAPKNPDMKYPSMHGPSVLSILCGKSFGVAPESNVNFFYLPSWIDDNMTRVDAFKKLIEVNKTLPENQKIKIVGLSDSVGNGIRKNANEYHKMVKEIEANGIMFFDVDTINIAHAHISYFNDRNDPNSYEPAQLLKLNTSMNYNNRKSLYIPSSGITTANGYFKDDYIYWINGGASWMVPYLVGVIALGLQVDPTLTKENAIKYLFDSATPFSDVTNGGLINPKGFINLVKQNAKTISPNAPKDPYYYVLYNSQRINDEDLNAIKDYASNNLDNAILKDISSYSSANQIYDMLKVDYKTRNGVLKGIQIFGSAPSNRMTKSIGAVPAFDISYKVLMENNKIDDMGQMNTDFFYSTFKNDSTLLNSNLSIYSIFNDKLNVSIIPEWPVVRLPLNKGEIAPYINKYKEYQKATDNKLLTTVNFSAAISAMKFQTDDMGYFLREKLDKEFNIINSTQYRLYGNTEGKYPLTNVIGNITKENIQKENSKEISTFFINSHGQPTNIDQTIFTNEGEQRKSFLNNDNVNSILNKNYYNMILWNCNNGYDLKDDNLIHKMLAGKAINVFGSTTILSNNGVNNEANFDQLKKNNFYYFQYVYFYYYYQLKQSMSDSFFAAKKAYVEECLKHNTMLGVGNYQFNLNNALEFHDFGLIEKSHYAKLPNDIPDLTVNNKVVPQSIKPANILTNNDHNGKVDLSCKVNGNNVVLTVNYDMNTKSKNLIYCVFDAPNGDIFKFLNNLKASKGTFTITLSKDKLNKVSDIGINIMIDNKDNFFGFNTLEMLNN